MRLGGTIRIESRDSGNSQVEFTLANNGPSISAEHLPKLFDSFFTSGKKGGTGLGLAIAHKVVTAHGGTIRCDSEPGKGVAFVFTLPAIADEKMASPSRLLPAHSSDFVKAVRALDSFENKEATDEEEEKRLSAVFEQSSKTFHRKLRILVLDDEQIYRDGLSSRLQQNALLVPYLEVVTVASPEEALVSEPADLAIVDVDLGSQTANGFDVVRSLRSRGDKGIICIHSNRILASDHKTAIENGADAFLPKPMSTVHLLKLVCQSQERLGIAKPITSSGGNEEQGCGSENQPEGATSVFAFIDDVRTLRMGWEMDWPLGKLVTFASPEAFWKHAQEYPKFLESLAGVITDFNFGDSSATDGGEFAKELKLRLSIPVALASNGDHALSDFGGTVDAILSKECPNLETAQRVFLKAKKP